MPRTPHTIIRSNSTRVLDVASLVAQVEAAALVGQVPTIEVRRAADGDYVATVTSAAAHLWSTVVTSDADEITSIIAAARGPEFDAHLEAAYEDRY